jgi:hypothetical protein
MTRGRGRKRAGPCYSRSSTGLSESPGRSRGKSCLKDQAAVGACRSNRRTTSKRLPFHLRGSLRISWRPAIAGSMRLMIRLCSQQTSMTPFNVLISFINSSSCPFRHARPSRSCGCESRGPGSSGALRRGNRLRSVQSHRAGTKVAGARCATALRAPGAPPTHKVVAPRAILFPGRSIKAQSVPVR